MRCTFKVSIVGVGKVGATAAYALLLDGRVTDLTLVAHDVAKAQGELDDLEQSLPFLQHVDLVLTDDYAAIAGSDVTIITAGAAQHDAETRLDLVEQNKRILDRIIPQVKQANPDGVIVMVTNPVDVLTQYCYQLADFRPGQVLGSGTVLDTARFRKNIAEIFGVNPRSIHAYVLGEHGDSSFPLLSSANIGGQLLRELPEYDETAVMQAFERAQQAAYRIIQSKGATYYAIATVIMTIVRAIFADARTVLPVSVPLHDYHGISGIALSVPCVVGARGVERQLLVSLSEIEHELLLRSADVLRQINKPL